MSKDEKVRRIKTLFRTARPTWVMCFSCNPYASFEARFKALVAQTRRKANRWMERTDDIGTGKVGQ